MSDRQRGHGTGRGVQRQTVVVKPSTPRQRGDGERRAARGVQRETVAVTRRVPSRLRGVFTAGFVTSCWNALVVFLPILVAVILAWWIAGRPGGVGTVVRTAGAGWLIGHGVDVGIAGLTVGLAPVLLTAIVFWRLTKAGAHTVRAIRGRSFPAVRAATIAVSASYTVVVTVAAFFVAAAPFDVTVWQASAHAAVLSVVAGSLGALGESGGGRALWHRMPVWLRRGLRTGMLNTLMLLAVGALLAGAALAVRGTAVTATLEAYPDGVIAVGALTLLYLPTVAGWGMAYVIGPGFAVGVETNVSIIGVDIGPMPVFPLFAAVPDGPLGAAGTLLYGLPILIASVYGVRLGLRSFDLTTGRLLGAVAVSGLGAAGLTALVAHLCSGALGEARMAVVGPDPLSVAVVSGLVTTVFGLVGCLAVRYLGGRRAHTGPAPGDEQTEG